MEARRQVAVHLVQVSDDSVWTRMGGSRRNGKK